MAADHPRMLLLAALLVGVGALPAWADGPYVVGSDEDPDLTREGRDLGPRIVDIVLLRSHRYSDRFSVESVAVAPNGREVAAISRVARAGALAWDVESGRPLKLPPMPSGATVVAYSSRMKHVAAAVSADVLEDSFGGVDVYDLDTGRSPPPLEGGSDALDLAFSPDDRVLVAAVGDGVIGWNLDGGRPVDIIGVPGGADMVAFISAGELVVGADRGRLVMRVSVADGRVQETWDGRGGSASAVSPDGRLIAMGGNDAVRIVDLWGGGRPQIVPVSEEITALDWSADGRVLAAGTSGGNVLVFAVDGVTGLSRDPGPTSLGGGGGRGPVSRPERDSGSNDLNRGRDDGTGTIFGRGGGRGGSSGGSSGGGPVIAEPPEESAEIVGEVTVLVLDTIGTDPRTSSKMERSLRNNIKKLEPCWKREARKGNPARGEIVIPMSVSPDGEGRGFGDPPTDTVGNEKLLECVQDKLRGALFPPGLGSIEVELTLTLREER